MTRKATMATSPPPTPTTDSAPPAAKSGPVPTQVRKTFHAKGAMSPKCDSTSWPTDGKAVANELGFFDKEYRWASDNDSPGSSHRIVVRVLNPADKSDLRDLQPDDPCMFCLQNMRHSTNLCIFMRTLPWPPPTTTE